MKLVKSFIFTAAIVLITLVVISNASNLKLSNNNESPTPEEKDDKLIFNVESGMRLLKNIYKKKIKQPFIIKKFRLLKTFMLKLF